MLTTRQILQEDHYYPFGLNISALSSTAPLSKPNKFKLSGNEEQTEFDLNVYDFNARTYDPVIGRFMQVDPMADVQSNLTPYNYVENNPMRFIDPNGMLSTHIDSLGTVVAEYDDGDDGVYVHSEGTTKEEVDKQRKDNENTGGDGSHIGEIGGEINLDGIYDKLLSKNISIARGIVNPFNYHSLVTDYGDWDLKVNMSTIFGLANSTNTKFNWNGESYEAQDIGNHHFGATSLGVMAIRLAGEEFILKLAGSNQMSKVGRSKPEWQQYEEIKHYSYGRTDILNIWVERRMLPPYGDDPRDQKYIKQGFSYYRNR